MLSDTTPAAQRVWDELCRSATPEQRFASARSLSARTIALSKHAVYEAHPELPRWECDLIWAEMHYGRDIADKLRRHGAPR